MTLTDAQAQKLLALIQAADVGKVAFDSALRDVEFAASEMAGGKVELGEWDEVVPTCTTAEDVRGVLAGVEPDLPKSRKKVA